MNIIIEIQKECKRARKLKVVYNKIPTGSFGSMIIEIAIKKGEAAIECNDVMAMVVALKQLQALE